MCGCASGRAWTEGGWIGPTLSAEVLSFFHILILNDYYDLDDLDDLLILTATHTHR